MGIATLAMLAYVGGRITPSFTRNWLVKTLPGSGEPAPFGVLDRVGLATTLLAPVAWVALPDTTPTAVLQIIAGAALLLRLSRWHGARTGAEPLPFVLHLGYGWLALGHVVHGANKFVLVTDATTSLHTLTAGAIGTMTRAVMTRATGATRAARSSPIAEQSPNVSVTLAAVLRVGAPSRASIILSLSRPQPACGASNIRRGKFLLPRPVA